MKMKINKILHEIRMLGRSQGRWGRLYMDIKDMQDSNPDGYDDWVHEMEELCFEDTLDIVLYFEEGRKPKGYYALKRAQGYKVYSVEVTNSITKTINVVAKDANEAEALAAECDISDSDDVDTCTVVTGCRRLQNGD